MSTPYFILLFSLLLVWSFKHSDQTDCSLHFTSYSNQLIYTVQISNTSVESGWFHRLVILLESDSIDGNHSCFPPTVQYITLQATRMSLNLTNPLPMSEKVQPIVTETLTHTVGGRDKIMKFSRETLFWNVIEQCKVF